ncbi:hypothetical protein HDV00_012577, partial [Rhizophlyctis rosea]
MPTLRPTSTSTFGIFFRTRISQQPTTRFFPLHTHLYIPTRLFTTLPTPLLTPRDTMSTTIDPLPRVDHARRAESGPGGAEIVGDFDQGNLKSRAAAPAGQVKSKGAKEASEDESGRWKETLERVIKS